MTDTTNITNINAFFVGKKCVIRTYSAGVWFGEIAIKDHDEVIVLNARRLWGWRAAESISLSAVALYGLVHAESRVPAAVPHLWLQAIELIPASHTGIESIESCPETAAQ